MEWKRVSGTSDVNAGSTPQQFQRCAVAIAIFDPPSGADSDKYMRLFIGDVVIVEKKCADWYFGRLLDDVNRSGVFPQSYVKFKGASKVVDTAIRTSLDSDAGGSNFGSNTRCNSISETTSNMVSYDSPMVHEVSTVLRAWVKCCRAAYKGRKNDEVLQVVAMMQDVTKWRKQILSGKLPVDEVKKLKQKISRKIDVGNKKLGLDLIVRDGNCDVLSPDTCSLMELYRHHVYAGEQIEHDSRTTIPIKSLRPTTGHQSISSKSSVFSPIGVAQNAHLPASHSLYVNILDFYCRASGDAHLSLALYDAKEQQFISEFFTMTWPHFGESTDENARRTSAAPGGHGQKILFTDLGCKDLSRDRLYLICRVARTGTFESGKEHSTSGHHDSTSSIGSGNATTTTGRRTRVWQLYAFGAMELRDVLQNGGAMAGLGAGGQFNQEVDHERHWFIPLFQCFDDNMEQVLKRVVDPRIPAFPVGATPTASGRSMSVPDVHVHNMALSNNHATTKDQGVWIGSQMMVGNQDEVKTTYAHVFTSAPAVVRKMGFPEVISSGDVRNDLYVTLVQGDFSHCGRSDKNIETKACMVDEKGTVLQDAVIRVGPKIKTMAYYTSTVRYHEDKPKWGETFKMAIPMEKYNTSHVRFTFRHRSSNESKDKAERPFAMAFLRLMQINETIIGNGTHELIVYKLDRKFEEQNEASYHSLPSTRDELDRWAQMNHTGSKASPSAPCVSLSPKDSFQIRTVVCSTSLTQNADLLGLLNWQSKRGDIRQSLESLMKSEMDRIGEELVKFLNNVLDALFDILTQLNDYDQEAFDCLMKVIGLVSEPRYSSFKPILDEYLRLHFCAPLVYRKLIILFKDYVENVEERYAPLLNAFKSMEYLMKFIVRSRQLCVKLSGSVDDFARLMNQLLKSISDLMLLQSSHSVVCQGAGLRYLPHCVGDIAQAVDGQDLAVVIVNTLRNVPDGWLQKEKLWCIQNLIKSDLCRRSEYRRILQPEFLRIVCSHIERDSELEICANILCDLMVVLYGTESTWNPQQSDLHDIVRFCLRPVVQVIVRLIQLTETRPDVTAWASRLPSFIALLLALLSELDAELYDKYANKFVTRTDLIDFLTELLMLFKDIIEKTIFSSDWFQMICKRNAVLLKILRFITCTIKKRFLHDFEAEVWGVCFRTLVTFITQKNLQLEQFPPEKRNIVLCRYGDMREICASELASCWFSMNFAEKRPFIPAMVGPFLEVTLLSQQRVRSLTIPIFFDMMIVGLYQMEARNGSISESERVFVTFERELISPLDALVEQGRGDQTYMDSFGRIMESRRSTHASQLYKMGKRLTTTVKQLMTKLLEFREVREQHNCLDNRMSCTRKLLEFYGSIEHTALYVQYVHKLYELHMECDNYAEAAFTLKLHADKLRWSDDSVPAELLLETYKGCATERKLKERLYYDILALFDRGKLWEHAIEICGELQKEYEENSFDYVNLGGMLEKMSKLYRNIMAIGQHSPELFRAAPEYYRVAFYGDGFPRFLREQVFVYRAQPCERLPEFTARMKSQFPKAQETSGLACPTEQQLRSSQQFIQINKVDPVCDDDQFLKRFKGRKVDNRISSYYKHNQVQKFFHTRQIRPPKAENGTDRKSGIQDNEFSTMWLERSIIVISSPLPGVMRFFPVVSTSTRIVSPLEVAIDTMQEANKQLIAVIVCVEQTEGSELKPLEAKLQGMLQPAVMGGISNYEKTFFTEEYSDQCEPHELAYINQLKDLIATQIPLLEKALYIHAKYCPDEQIPFHEMLREAFVNYKKTVEEKYGHKPSLLPPDASLIPWRQQQQQQKLTKHASVDGGTASTGDLGHFKRQGTRDWPTSHTSWGLRHGISSLTVSGMSTVPRRNPSGGTAFKRKPSQPLDSSARDGVRDRLSNTSVGSTLSMELAGADSSPSTAPIAATSTPVGNATFFNGVFTLSEQVTPQRPLRPASGATVASSVRTGGRSASNHSLSTGNSHETTPAPSECGQDGMKSYDRVPTPLKFHISSLDSLHENDTPVEPPPQLPPRHPSATGLYRQSSSGSFPRQLSATGPRLIRGESEIREEDENTSNETADSVDAVENGHRACSTNQQHMFVIPRRTKPLPPKPTDNNDHGGVL